MKLPDSLAWLTVTDKDDPRSFDSMMERALGRAMDRFPLIAGTLWGAAIGGMFGFFGGALAAAFQGLPNQARWMMGLLWGTYGAGVGAAGILLLLSPLAQFLLVVFLLVGFVRWAWDWWGA